jgi:hypothetical protein
VLPGVYLEDIFVDRQCIRITGKGQSATIRQNRIPSTILQPVPALVLEAIRIYAREWKGDSKTGKLFEDVTTHAVGELCKEYGRLAAVPEWQSLGAHAERHWYSNAVRKRGVAQSPQGMLEWSDLLRHSRKSAGSTAVAFYSGGFTTFERRLEICLATWQPILEQLQSPTFTAGLPAPLPWTAPEKKNDTVSLRIVEKSMPFHEPRVDKHDSSYTYSKIDTLSTGSSLTGSVSVAAPAIPDRVDDNGTSPDVVSEPAVMDPLDGDEFSEDEFAEDDPDSHGSMTEQNTFSDTPGRLVPTESVEPAVASEPPQPSREQERLESWRRKIEKDHQDIVNLETEHKTTWKCTRDGCTGRAFCCDAKGKLVCEAHGLAPPDDWKP